jgi:hypothetical protein
MLSHLTSSNLFINLPQHDDGRELHPNAKPGEVKLFTFEVDPLFAAITSSFVELARLKDIVEVVVGSAEDSVRRLKAEGVLGRADVVLLDHWEKFYLSDLQVLEELGLIGRGSVVIADNTMRAPGYLEYVRGGKGRSGAEMRSESVESIMSMGIKVTFFSGDEMRYCGIGCFRDNYLPVVLKWSHITATRTARFRGTISICA